MDDIDEWKRSELERWMAQMEERERQMREKFTDKKGTDWMDKRVRWMRERDRLAHMDWLSWKDW